LWKTNWKTGKKKEIFLALRVNEKVNKFSHIKISCQNGFGVVIWSKDWVSTEMKFCPWVSGKTLVKKRETKKGVD